jgi:hypothetical protein
VSIDPTTGTIQKIVREGADADEVWYDPASDNIPLGSHSVAVNSSNQNVFVPVAGKGIFVAAPRIAAPRK